MAMESECLEPLNLVIKKDNNSSSNSTTSSESVLEPDDLSLSSTTTTGTVTANKKEDIVIDGDDNKVVDDAKVLMQTDPDNMAIEQLTNGNKKITDSNLAIADHKLLTALHMSNLMQLNLGNLRETTPESQVQVPPPYGTQYYFMQLLAMVEAQQLMCQQMNWSLPQHLVRSPMRLPTQAYFDNPAVNLSEQLTSNSLYAANVKHESDVKTASKRYDFFQVRSCDFKKIFYYSRSSMDQKNSSSLSSDITKAQDTGQQNNQG